jgi:hypothetical protein
VRWIFKASASEVTVRWIFKSNIRVTS